MPKSQFVAAQRLRPMIGYLAAAFLVVLAADAALQWLAPGGGARRILVAAWIVLFPLGGWLVWRRG